MWCRMIKRISVVAVVVIFPVAKCFLIMNALDNLNGTKALKTRDSDFDESRKNKQNDKYFMGLILAAILIKMILFPLAFKAMAVMTSVSVLLSTMSLVMSSIVGYAKLVSHGPPEPAVKLLHVNDVWAKGDELPKDYTGSDEYGPNVPLEQMHFNMK